MLRYTNTYHCITVYEHPVQVCSLEGIGYIAYLYSGLYHVDLCKYTMFAQQQNHLTQFSEHIPVGKHHMTVFIPLILITASEIIISSTVNR